MLSEEEKKEMLQDAASAERKQSFVRARKYRDAHPMSWPEYLEFLSSVQGFFIKEVFRNKTAGQNFKL